MSNSLIEITAIEIKELAVIEPKQASEKFELIAKTMSDDQLAEVIENIDIVTLTQINGQHDISFPSIISELMTPERIRDIVCQQPLYWEEAIKNNADELQQHTFDFLNYLIRTQDSEAKQREILECVAEDPAGLFYLAIPFIEFYRAIAMKRTKAIATCCTPKRKTSKSPCATASASRARMCTTMRWMTRAAC